MAIFISSCGLLGIHDFLDSGYVNDEWKYVPKRPNFRLKDKNGFILPANLDTTHIYRLVERYNFGDKIFPKTIPEKIVSDNETLDFLHYYKFFPKGRVLKYIKIIELSKDNYELKSEDLYPIKADKCYYFSRGTEKIQIESFYRGDGFGRYWMQIFCLNKTGDTLILGKDNDKSIFVIDSIPFNFNNFEVDW